MCGWKSASGQFSQLYFWWSHLWLVPESPSILANGFVTVFCLGLQMILACKDPWVFDLQGDHYCFGWRIRRCPFLGVILKVALDSANFVFSSLLWKCDGHGSTVFMICLHQNVNECEVQSSQCFDANTATSKCQISLEHNKKIGLIKSLGNVINLKWQHHFLT